MEDIIEDTIKGSESQFLLPKVLREASSERRLVRKRDSVFQYALEAHNLKPEIGK